MRCRRGTRVSNERSLTELYMHDGRLKKKNERHCDDMNDDDDTVQFNLTRM